MKSPTIKDIAREAGVSHGTVSNVLNGRGNVSVEKIRLVQDAAARLGYRINAGAQLLRKGTENTLLLVIPGIRFPQYADLYEVLQTELQAWGYRVQVYSTNALQVEEEAALDLALGSRVAAIVGVLGLEPGNRKLQTVAGRIPTVLLDNHRSACKGTLTAGFRWEDAGRRIACSLNDREAKSVGVFTGDSAATHMQDFLAGFSAEFLGQARFLESSDQLLDVQAFDLFDGDEVFDCIVCTDEHRRQAVLRALSYSRPGQNPPVMAVASRRAVVQSGGLCYAMDYKTLACNIVERLLGENKGVPLILEGTGFSGSIPRAKQGGGSLEFLTVTSPSSYALARLLPHFKDKTGIDVRLTVVSLEELYDMARTLEPDSPFDLVRMDMMWISELAPLVYTPLADLPFDWGNITDEMMPFFLEDYTSTRQVRYCLPYDPSVQIFFYRKDLFEDPTVKRMYYEMAREELTVPKTFADYNKAARFFTRAFNSASPVLYGTTTAVGNSTVSPDEYMPRLFGEGGSFFDNNGRIDLETPAAAAALENYMETYRYSDKSIYQWWHGALEGFSNGSAAMTIVFMNYASNIVNAKNSNVAGRIGFAPVPGKKPLLGGGVVGITQGCKKPREAFAFLRWLYSSEIAPAFTLLGGLSPCKGAYDNRDVLELYPWLAAARDSFPIGQRRLHNNNYINFSEKRLEAIISTQVKNAVLGLVSPQEALHRAQEECGATFVPLLNGSW